MHSSVFFNSLELNVQLNAYEILIPSKFKSTKHGFQPAATAQIARTHLRDHQHKLLIMLGI